VVVALYPGTFDPVTDGHLDIARRAARLFDRVVVAVGASVEKRMLLSVEERVGLVREAVRDLKNVAVEPFDGLVVEFARAQGAEVLVRGLRNQADYEYEHRMALTNRRLAPGLETVFVVAAPEFAFISSTLIKEVLAAGGPVDEFVPPHVAEALRRKRG
jgi:pantetheine-phosphate adenylyltransferase